MIKKPMLAARIEKLSSMCTKNKLDVGNKAIFLKEGYGDGVNIVTIKNIEIEYDEEDGNYNTKYTLTSKEWFDEVEVYNRIIPYSKEKYILLKSLISKRSKLDEQIDNIFDCCR